MNTATKINRAMREACWEISQTRKPTWGRAVFEMCAAAGLMVPVHEVGEGLYALTDAGKAIAADFDVKRTERLQRRRKNDRDRNDAMRSLGLVKTPWGWE